VEHETEHRLQSDLVALAARIRADDAFADELYCALCNTDWQHDDGTEWSGSWRYAAGLMAELRELGECYLDFYCSASGGEGTVTERVEVAMADLGWHGTAHGRQLWRIDYRTGERKVWIDGDWVDPDNTPS
jgi:hypothetical protein